MKRSNRETKRDNKQQSLNNTALQMEFKYAMQLQKQGQRDDKEKWNYRYTKVYKMLLNIQQK